jgi:hypothetical protein
VGPWAFQLPHPEDAAEKATIYAERWLMWWKLVSTAVIAHRITAGQINVAPEVRPDLMEFFNHNPQFVFSSDYVDAYLAEDGGAKLDWLKDDRKARLARLRDQMRILERVDKLTPRQVPVGAPPRYQQLDLLLSHGFDSAHKITRLGRRDFVAVMETALGGSPTPAEVIYANAEQTTAMATALLARYGQAFNPIDIPVMASHATTGSPASVPANGIPDVRALFGNLDFCDCEECRSVYSPLHLVDILQFLADRKTGWQLLLQVLSGRRPTLPTWS